TLLLTFFYRQMAALVERGHIYIAQPPLYKVRRGKQEDYVKDEKELSEYLLRLALSDASFQPGGEAPRVTGEELARLIRQYLTTMDMIDHLARRTDPNILRAMVDLPALDEDALRHGRRIEDWFRHLMEYANRGQ